MRRAFPTSLVYGARSSSGGGYQSGRAIPGKPSPANPGHPLMCPRCSTFYKTAELLFNHQLASAHFDLYCCLCNKTLSSREKLKRHVNSVHCGQMYNCWFCTKSYNREDHMLEHIFNAHGLAACKKCQATFPSKDMLKEHRKVHFQWWSWKFDHLWV